MQIKKKGEWRRGKGRGQRKAAEEGNSWSGKWKEGRQAGRKGAETSNEKFRYVGSFSHKVYGR